MSHFDNRKAKIKQLNVDSTVYNIHFNREIRKFLTAPPFLPEIFLGRTDDLQTVRQLLFEEANMLLLVNGRGGVGKTSLAAQYFHNHHEDYQHLAWVYTENNLTDALLGLAVALELKFDDQIPLEKRLPLLLQEMANLDKPCLLVIDNVNNPQELNKHYLALRRCPNFHLLLTTRITEFERAQTHKIEGLPKDEAKKLFKKHYPLHDETEDALLEQIYDAVWGNTLVLELLAKNLNNFNNKLKKRYTLHDLLKDLQEKGLLQVQSKQVKATYQAKNAALREETPEDIITAMYELNELTQPEQKALSIFSTLPAESIDFEVLQGLLKDWTDLDQCLLGLSQKGWLEEADGTFKISPVIQEITKKKRPDLLEDCRELINAFIEILDYEGAIGHLVNIGYKEAFLMVRYGSSLVDNIAPADNDLAILCERIGSYYKTTGNLQQAMTFFEQRSKIGQELFEAYPDNVSFKNGLAIAYEKLGETHSALGNFQQALTFFEDETQLFEELFEAYPDNVSFKNGLAISYSKLGSTHSALGNLQQALTFFEQRSKIGQELFEAFPDNVSFKNGLAIAYEKLGSTHSALGNLQQALTFFEDETQLFEELFEAYPDNVSFKNGLAIAYSKLGETQSKLGNLQQALTFFEQYKQLRKELFEAYPDNVSFKNGLALSYQWLGWHYEQKMQQKEKAIPYYEKSKVLLEELVTSFPDYAEFKKNLDWVSQELS